MGASSRPGCPSRSNPRNAHIAVFSASSKGMWPSSPPPLKISRSLFTMDASDLVSQMHETLSTMHMTLSSLSIAAHEAKLKYLEAQRDSALDALRAAFERESAELGGKRRAERETVAEQRRREDEERVRRRRAEDEERERREDALDQERKARLADDTEEVEEEAEDLMVAVEEQAERLLIEGKMRLEELEARRKVCFSFIFASVALFGCGFDRLSLERVRADGCSPSCRRSTASSTRGSGVRSRRRRCGPGEIHERATESPGSRIFMGIPMTRRLWEPTACLAPRTRPP